MEIFCSLPVPKIFRRYVQNAVRVDVECHFDLRNAARRRRNSIEMECAEILVVARKRSLALQHFDFHARLIVAVSRKDLRLTSRDRRVTRNHRRRDSARGFNRQRERSHVEEQHVFDVALEHAALNRRANRDDFIRDSHLCAVPCRSDCRAVSIDLRHARHTADEHQLVDFFLGQLRVFQTRLHRRNRSLEQIIA